MVCFVILAVASFMSIPVSVLLSVRQHKACHIVIKHTTNWTTSADHFLTSRCCVEKLTNIPSKYLCLHTIDTVCSCLWSEKNLSKKNSSEWRESWAYYYIPLKMQKIRKVCMFGIKQDIYISWGNIAEEKWWQVGTIWKIRSASMNNHSLDKK